MDEPYERGICAACRKNRSLNPNDRSSFCGPCLEIAAQFQPCSTCCFVTVKLPAMQCPRCESASRTLCDLCGTRYARRTYLLQDRFGEPFGASICEACSSDENGFGEYLREQLANTPRNGGLGELAALDQIYLNQRDKGHG